MGDLVKTTATHEESVALVSEGWTNSAFSCQVNHEGAIVDPAVSVAKTAVSGAKSATSQAVQTWNIVSQGASNLISGTAFTEGGEYYELADAASSAALSYLNSKIERIKTLWNTPATVNLESLLGEVGLFIRPVSESWPLVKERLVKLVSYLVGTDSSDWKGLLSDLGQDAVGSLMSDPSLIEATSNLTAIQSYASILNTFSTTIDSFKKIMNVVEELLPVLKLTSELALTVWSGGTTLIESGSVATEWLNEKGQRLVSLSMGIIRKFLGKMQINVPSLLVGALKTLSIKDAVTDYSDNAWVQAFFSEEFYEQTSNSITWYDSINSTLNEYQNKIDDWSSFNFGGAQSEEMKNSFLSSMTRTFMTTAVSQARIKAGLAANAILESWYKPSDGNDESNSGNDSSDSNSTNDSSGTSNTTDLDKTLEDNSEENPINDEESLRIVSKRIYDNLV